MTTETSLISQSTGGASQLIETRNAYKRVVWKIRQFWGREVDGKVFNFEKYLWKFHVTRSELHQFRLRWQDFMLTVIKLQVHLAGHMPILASLVNLFYDL